MLKHIALRLRRAGDAHIGFSRRGARVVSSSLEMRDPALKNLTEGLHELGLAYWVDDCALYWFQIDDQHDVDFYASLNEVECVFDSEWFEQTKQRIRHYSGVRYYEACCELARSLPIKDQQRQIDYRADVVAA